MAHIHVDIPYEDEMTFLLRKPLFPATTLNPVFVLPLPIFFMGQRTFPDLRVVQGSRSSSTEFIRGKSRLYHLLSTWGRLSNSATS
jgi:hypothetical protein